MHIKTIKGKKYYYESVRIGKRVTSKYIGPVDKIDAMKMQTQQLDAQQMQDAGAPAGPEGDYSGEGSDDSTSDDGYIG